ncbi:hypothetical protein DFP92_1404 [Yoonia sediminilitoris]|uniref:Uncharacterized protein n=1 Tax=Yoonia sediminilitoris TaxID=1286148 RepID=A0A2T6K116_9RHOB|nr:hypothetical protein C8N45_1414 [Yoonia sediminilitoris]RCW89416.1 hypothetical protein DFP92_1404 [Yoonia sediminilitoris]
MQRFQSRHCKLNIVSIARPHRDLNPVGAQSKHHATVLLSFSLFKFRQFFRFNFFGNSVGVFCYAISQKN